MCTSVGVCVCVCVCSRVEKVNGPKRRAHCRVDKRARVRVPTV